MTEKRRIVKESNEEASNLTSTSSVSVVESMPPIRKSPHFGTVQEVVERYTHCEICGGIMHFSHFTDFALNLTQELSKCPECHHSNRPMIYQLQ